MSTFQRIVIGILLAIFAVGACVGAFVVSYTLGKSTLPISVPVIREQNPVVRQEEPVVGNNDEPVLNGPSAVDPDSNEAPPSSTPDCAAIPVNDVDGERVPLTEGFYALEEFDNTVSPKLHSFWAYNVASQGNLTVWADANTGIRAWACTNADEAFKWATLSAAGKKSEHNDYKVVGPDGEEVTH